jgi:ABC-type thiamin/hydroxymethylpyrimidine transport system permease subunit
MRAAKIYLILMAIMSVVFGVIYLFWPLSMTDPMGFGPLAPSALTDVRATYGGFQIGTGLFMLFCLRPDRLRLGMLLALLSVGAIAGSRAIGLVIDGAFTDVLKGTITFEITLFVISLILFLRTPDAAPKAA